MVRSVAAVVIVSFKIFIEKHNMSNLSIKKGEGALLGSDSNETQSRFSRYV